MIPKIIHYCWFGGNPVPKNVINYIDSWKKYCPDYEVIQWNENNFDVRMNIFVTQAYECQKWAFVSDYARLKVLYDYGGIYLDTDVEVLKSFDPLLNDTVFLCAESNYSICTATIGAEAGSKFIKKLIDIYDNKKFLNEGKEDITPNSRLIFELLRLNDGYKYSETPFKTLDYTIYPSNYFSPINCYTFQTKVTPNTYSIHWYAGTWKTKGEKIKDIIFAMITRILGEDIREEIKKSFKKVLKKLKY